MKYKYNNSKFKWRRKELRKKHTFPEQLLWAYLRNYKLGYKFWRQYSVGPYIVDFYCPSIRLAIELDGRHHAREDVRVYDEERADYLEGANIKVLRFWNEQVINQRNDVINTIKRHVKPPS